MMKTIPLPVIFTFLLALLMACNNAGTASKADETADTLALPMIKESKGVKQLYVNKKPFLIIGGELLNSSSSSVEHMKDTWAAIKSLHVNTVFLPVNWQQFEPKWKNQFN